MVVLPESLWVGEIKLLPICHAPGCMAEYEAAPPYGIYVKAHRHGGRIFWSVALYSEVGQERWESSYDFKEACRLAARTYTEQTIKHVEALERFKKAGVV